MTARTRTELRRRVQALVGRWQKRLGLELWFILIEFNSEVSYCAVRWSPGYRNAVLMVNPKSEARYENRRWLEHSVVHELCHLLLASVSDVHDVYAKVDSPLGLELHRGVETTADTLTSLFLRARW